MSGSQRTASLGSRVRVVSAWVLAGGVVAAYVRRAKGRAVSAVVLSLSLIVFLALVARTVAVSVAAASLGGGGTLQVRALMDVLVVVVPVSFASVGALVAYRRPSHPVGWLLGAFGIVFTLTLLTESYVELPEAGLLPGIELAAWLQTWVWAVGLLLLSALVMHFPTGRLPSPMWRPLRWFSAAVGLLVIAAWMTIWPARHEPGLLVDSAAFPPLARHIEQIAEPAVMISLLASVASLVARYRRADQLQRSQLKWLFLAVAVAASGIMTFALSGGPSRAPVLGQVLTLAGMTGVPVAIGVAVLRYRLFEIDRVISRTLAYALLTAVLAGVYAVGVLGVGELVPREGNDLVVAGSTLVVAALFQPLRHRVQSLVDRRFNRSRYDAQAAVGSFGAKLRDEVDLDRLADELGDVIGRTLHPSRVSLWLAGAAP